MSVELHLFICLLIVAGATAEQASGKAAGINAVFAEDDLTVPDDAVAPKEKEIQLMTNDDLNQLHTALGTHFSDIKRNVDGIVAQVDTALADAGDSSDQDVDQMQKDVENFRETSLGFQKGIENAFSLILVQDLHNVSGFCCCWHEDTKNRDYCRWNQAAKQAVFFKKKGCDLLGMSEWGDHIVNLASTIKKNGVDVPQANGGSLKDMFSAAAGLSSSSSTPQEVFDKSATALGDTQSCSPFISSALQLTAGQRNLFDEKVWQNTDPPDEFLSNGALDTAIRAEWSATQVLRQKDGGIKKRLSDAAASQCDQDRNLEILYDAYMSYVPPEDYTDLITRVSQCAEARDLTSRMVNGKESWDPHIMRSKIEMLEPLLRAGSPADVILSNKLAQQAQERRDLKDEIQQALDDYHQARPALNDGVRLWADAMQVGLTPDNVAVLLDSGIRAASDSNLRYAREAALKRHLTSELDRLATEHNEREDLDILRTSLLTPVGSEPQSGTGSATGMQSGTGSSGTGNEGDISLGQKYMAYDPSINATHPRTITHRSKSSLLGEDQEAQDMPLMVAPPMSQGPFAPYGSEMWYKQQAENMASPFAMASSMAQGQEVHMAKSNLRRTSDDSQETKGASSSKVSDDVSVGLSAPPTRTKAADVAEDLLTLQLLANSDASQQTNQNGPANNAPLPASFLQKEMIQAPGQKFAQVSQTTAQHLSSAMQECKEKWDSLCDEVKKNQKKHTEHIPESSFLARESTEKKKPEWDTQEMWGAWAQICEYLLFDDVTMSHMKNDLLVTLKNTRSMFPQSTGGGLMECLEKDEVRGTEEVPKSGISEKVKHHKPVDIHSQSTEDVAGEARQVLSNSESALQIKLLSKIHGPKPGTI